MPELSFFQKPAVDLTYSDIQRLVMDKTPESHILDYKSENYKDSSELAKDICAFANTNGGWLILGIQEGIEDEARVPVKIVGIEKHPDLRKRLDDMIINSISARPRVDFSNPIQIPDSEKVVLVIRSQRSFDSLHMVMVKGKGKKDYQFRYYRRYHDQNVPMDEYEVRTRYEQLKKGEKNIEERLQGVTKQILMKIGGPYETALVMSSSPLFTSIRFNNFDLVKSFDDNDKYRKPWIRYDGHTATRIRMDYFEKMDSRQNPKAVMRQYFDGCISYATRFIYPSQETKVISAGYVVWELYHTLRIFFDYYQRFEFWGYLKLVASIENVQNKILIFPGFEQYSYGREAQPLGNSYDPIIKVIEANMLLNERRQIIDEIIQPLFNEAGIPEYTDKCWDQNNAPFYEKYH